MREILTIHVGQACINIGDTFWKQLSKEHDIDSNGRCSNLNDQKSRSEVYFDEASEARFTPRAIFTDLDSNSVNDLRANNSISQLYNSNNFISQNSGARNNWAIGDTPGDANYWIKQWKLQIKRLNDIFHAISGGTGSEMGSLIMQKIRQQYSSRILTTCTVFLDLADSVLAPYNATLSMHHMVENSNLTLTIDNQALNNICFRTFSSNLKFQDFNAVISQGLCDLTASQRFPGTSIGNIFKQLSKQFYVMFRRKAYLHWYLAEGMDEMEFIEFGQNMSDLDSEYYSYQYATVDELDESWEEVQ